ncbi:nuclease-related domain-containing DEAD/DEAH box helicase [Propioniciclava coleopterorum]|uniref:nuclease-related domain-containing DEAD/DEAH box helicase n=1 Tax=Propioniciclava coleopterorum TaxID=2714937 RepID=UPI001FEA584E|nr:NERD domain-containing protein [Propioniciclava coleopterorum]
MTTSEKEVWRLLVDQLPDGCVVLANLRVCGEERDHEADLVCLMPGNGIVVVEVKGNRVWVEDDQWYQKWGGSSRWIDPVDQAARTMYALRDYAEGDFRHGGPRLCWSRHVVLAHTALEQDFAMPECPRWQISGSNDLGDLGARIWETTASHRPFGRIPDADDVDALQEILTGRYLPSRDVVTEAEDRALEADRLTAEQAMLLQVTRLLNRVEIRGGAGSGKTVLAIRQASDLASGRLTGERRRVAVVCYSIGLSRHLRRHLLRGTKADRPVFVGTFEEFGNRFGVRSPGREESERWEHDFPAEVAERVSTLDEADRFDAIVVDEAQDFADHWWPALLLALKDEEAGGLYAYSDERQRIFPRFGRPPIQFVPLVLDHNLRNTRQIAEAFLPLAPTGMDIRGGDGPEVTFVAAPTAEALDAADDQVDTLFDEGWRPVDIALITMGKRHPVQEERQASLGQDGYWRSFWSEDDIFYGHVLGFKGMERPAVVLCVNEDGDRDRSAERFYVGLSRATDRLIVVGDPAVVRRIAGADVARRLGL